MVDAGGFRSGPPAPPPLVEVVLRYAAGFSLMTLAPPLAEFGLTLLYARVLTPAELGVLEVLWKTAGIAHIALTLGLTVALNALFFDAPPVDRPGLARKSLTLVGGIGVAACVAALVFAEPLSALLFGGVVQADLIRLAAPSLISAPLVAVATVLLRLNRQVRATNLVGALILGAGIGASVWLVAGLAAGIQGAAAANTIASVTVAALALACVWPRQSALPGQRTYRGILAAGLTAIPATFCWIALTNADRVILAQTSLPADVGVYSFAGRLATLAGVPFVVIWAAWLPIAAEWLSRDRVAAGRALSKAQAYFCAVAVLIAFFGGAAAPFLVNLLASAEYAGAAPMVATLMFFTGPMTYLSASFAIPLYTSGRLGWISLINAVGLGLNLLLNLALDPVLGAWGAVISLNAAGIVIAVSSLLVSRRFESVPYNLRATAGMLLLYPILLVVANLVDGVGMTIWPRLAGLAILLAAMRAVGWIPRFGARRPGAKTP
jgi:O-antigen/teichoic acid export membrane protein